MFQNIKSFWVNNRILKEVASLSIAQFLTVFIYSYVNASEVDKNKFECVRYGNEFKSTPLFNSCLKTDGYFRLELVANDPDGSNTNIRDIEPNARLRIDNKFLRETEIGTLGAFIRLQADYDPTISDDLIAGRVADDFAVGLDAFEIALDNSAGSFRLGEIENAGAAFIENGFTDRGAEGLDARSGLGASYQRNFGAYEVRISINDPRETTDQNPISPNAGVGLSRKIGAFKFGFGAALVNVDRFIITGSAPNAIRNGIALLQSNSATLGFGVGGDILYQTEKIKAFVGATYSDNASNDVIFSFSDGFDAVTLYGGVSVSILPKLTFNADVSYVSAVEKGLKNFNGVESAINLVWHPTPQWTLLGEIGFDSVDNFGAGDGFFFASENQGEVDFLLQLQRNF